MQMGSARFFEKKFRWEKSLANDFVSVRRMLDGQLPPSSELQTDVLNRAIKYTFENHEAIRGLMKMAQMSRVNGGKVTIKVSEENWYMIQGLLESLYQGIDEGDLIQFCVKTYLDKVKVARSIL